VIEEFEKEYQRDIEDVTRQEHEKEMFKRGELPERFMARKLFGWSDKRYIGADWKETRDGRRVNNQEKGK